MSQYIPISLDRKNPVPNRYGVKLPAHIVSQEVLLKLFSDKVSS